MKGYYCIPMDRRPPAIFVGNALGLDFLNSIATPLDTAVDWIDDGEGYLSWLEQAGPSQAFTSEKSSVQTSRASASPTGSSSASGLRHRRTV